MDLNENISSNYCMKEVKVSKNYRITIPSRIRKELGIQIGNTLFVQVERNKIVLIKKTGDIASLGLALGRKITNEEVNETIKEAGNEIGNTNP